MDKKLKRGWLMGVLIAVLLLTACTNTAETETEKEEPAGSNQVQVYTTLYPLEFFSQRIGGEHVQVTNIVPTGVDTHTFEPSAKDLAGLTEADLLIINGAGFEPWIDQLQNVVDEQQTTQVDTSKSLDLLSAQNDTSEETEHHEEEHHAHEEEHANEEDHSHGEFDPHVWLDPQRAKQQALAIKDALVTKDPDHQTDYEKNYEQLAKELDQLDQEFANQVKNAKKKEFVVSHNAFAYLADRYGLKQIPITGLTHGDEPSAKELEDIIHTIQEHDLKVIFFETLVQVDVAQTVQKEADVKAMTLNPLEGLTKEEVNEQADYFSVMKQNMKNLATALESQ